MSVKRAKLDRRHFLKGTGAAVSLPLLSAMTPAFGADATNKPAPRFVAMCGGLGFHAPNLFPKTPGADYEMTPYLSQLKEHRKDFTVFSGLSHPNQNGNNGHASGMTWLTSAQRPGLAGFKNTISLDQVIAEHFAGETRIPFLNLANDGNSLSWTANGINIPSQQSPAKLYKILFVDGSKDEVAAQMRKLRRGKSILDTVRGDAKKLEKKLGHQDQEKLDEYFTAVRDLEKRISQSEQWAQKPKPKVDYSEPKDVTDKKDIVARQRLMYDMTVLALQTDSTRAITYSLGSMNAVPTNIPGVKSDWHNLSHHGKDEAKIAELQKIEEVEFAELNRFLSKLKAIKEADKTLLDNTTILFGSNLGNASSHSWKNLPIILAGGGFKHGSYVAHDEKNNTPFANLFVAIAQNMGIEINKFGSSTSESVRGLEV